MQIAIAILLSLVIVANLIPAIRLSVWWIRGFDFPRYLLLSLMICCFGIAVVTGLPSDNVTLLLWFAGAGVLFYQLRTLLVYTHFGRIEAPAVEGEFDEDRLVSLLVANVLMTNRDAAPLLELINREKPDIVILLEPDSWWGEQTEGLKETYEWHIEDLRDNLYGIQLYSQLELIDPYIDYILKKDIPSIKTQVRLASGDIFNLFCLHPEPPSPSEADSSAPRDAELLICGREIRDMTNPSIVAGDLNDVAWSRSNDLFQRVSGLLDPRKGRGMFNTFSAEHWWLRWPLDHVFHSPSFKVHRLCRHEDIGSDHFPIQVELVLERQNGNEGEAPELERDDITDAEETISEGIQKVEEEEEESQQSDSNKD